MKANYFSFFVLLTGLFACSIKSNEVNIRGKISHYDSEKLKYSLPVNCMSFWGFTDSSKIDSSGTFDIVKTVDKPSFFQVFTSDSPILIIEPGNEYEIAFNNDSVIPNYSIKSNLKDIQNYYSGLEKLNPRSCEYWEGKDISQFLIIKKDLRDGLHRELHELNKFYQNGSISKDTYELLKIDREIYYFTAEQCLASQNAVRAISDGQEISQEIFKLWSDAALPLTANNSDILRANYAYDFLELFFWYKVYSTFNIKEFQETRKEFRAKGLIHTHSLDLAKTFYDGEILEFYTATYIFINATRKLHEREFISIMERFRKDFPNSQYSQYLEPQINQIIDSKL